MPTAPAAEKESEDVGAEGEAGRRSPFRRLAVAARRPFLRELLIVLAFCAFTALVTWPYVTRLRDAVVDPGDPYLVSWILWWDYHATFTDPLNLFHANTFYPYRYTLAFSEHCYGIAFPLFPLFALGLRPLTVHAVGMFLAFALCGYGAFRLTRTLTGSWGAAWVAGIAFAFVPFRFHIMSQLPYVFSAWLPLLFEALVLFARARTWRRAAWLGAAFAMTGLSSLSWLVLALFPFGLAVLILATRRGLWRERDFWVRGGAGLAGASLVLLPFTLPYYWVSKLYGFQRSIEEVKQYSAWPTHWLSVENRNKLWYGLGSAVHEGWRFKLFPGLLPVLLSLAALLLVNAPARREGPGEVTDVRRRWARRLDALAVFAFALSVLAVGFDRTEYFGGFFSNVTSERALTLLTLAVAARLCLAYPSVLRRGEGANLVETLRSERRSEGFWLGVMLVVVGFCYSLGWNFFFYRILYDLVPAFKSMRVPVRGAMMTYLGLAVLAGLGARRIAELLREMRPRIKPFAVYAALCALLLFELNAAPFKFMRGEVYPDAVTLRLKETEMRGGVVILPANATVNHRHMLRAADHAKPLVVGTSGFNSPYESEIETLTHAGAIPSRLLDLFEKIPASYLVIENSLILPERRADYETFLARAIASGRLRFINSFDGGSDLYAVTRTEPDARSEAALPFGPEAREWGALVEEDPVKMLGEYTEWSRALYRLHLVARGALPRHDEFVRDVRAVGRGLVMGFDNEAQERKLRENLRALAEGLTAGPEFVREYGALSDAEYAARLYANAGLDVDEGERAPLAEDLAAGRETRSTALLKVAEDPRLIERERERSLVLLYFFAYLRRNPGDPPEKDMRGFDYWVAEVKKHGGGDLSRAFSESIEYKRHLANSP